MRLEWNFVMPSGLSLSASGPISSLNTSRALSIEASSGYSIVVKLITASDILHSPLS